MYNESLPEICILISFFLEILKKWCVCNYIVHSFIRNSGNMSNAPTLVALLFTLYHHELLRCMVLVITFVLHGCRKHSISVLRCPVVDSFSLQYST